MPSPLPRVASTRVNASKTVAIFSSEMPIPVSNTSILHDILSMAATEQDAAARRRVFDRVVDQIAEDGFQKQRVADDRRTGRNHPNLNSLLQGGRLMFSTRVL